MEENDGDAVIALDFDQSGHWLLYVCIVLYNTRL